MVGIAYYRTRRSRHAVPPNIAPQYGFLVSRKAKFLRFFASDVDRRKKRVWADFPVSVGHVAIKRPIKRTRVEDQPSWYLVTLEAG